MLRPIAPILMAAFLLTACGEPQDTRPGQPVKTRQDAFAALLRSFEPLGKMLKEDRYDADEFASMAAELMTRRDAPWTHFGPDTNYPPSKSKPEVWEKAADFERAKKDFMDATDALSAAAQTGDKTKIEDVYGRVYQTCKSCHDDFRKR